MNGYERSAIISKSNTEIDWPNGLTIDYVSEKLFWVDAKLHSIVSSNYDGTGIVRILSSQTNLKHPFAITVFEDFLYWTDWETEAIHRANKFTGANSTSIALGLYSPMDIHMYHKLKQVKGKYCTYSVLVRNNINLH